MFSLIKNFRYFILTDYVTEENSLGYLEKKRWWVANMKKKTLGEGKRDENKRCCGQELWQ